MTEKTQPTGAELWQLWIPMAGRSGVADPVDFARAVLQRWGQPSVVGEPYGYAYTVQVAPIVGDERKVERTVFTRNKPTCKALPLYTQPQAGAVPLTDEQIDSLLWKYGYDPDDEHMAAMLKEAHGIKAKEAGNAE